MAQAVGVGVGVVAGFVGAVVLVAAALYLFIHSRFSANTTFLHLQTSPPQEPASGQESAPAKGVTSTEAHISSQASAPDPPDRDDGLSSPPPAPRTGWDIIVENKWNDLSTRPDTLRGPKAISENVGFEYGIERFVGGCIIGLGDPADRGKPVPESIFDENQLIQLAGEPANGATWSGFISNPDTRALAITCFLSRVLYRRMNPFEDVEKCLLAPEITACYRIMTAHTCTNQHGRDDIVGEWRNLVYAANHSSYNIRPPRSTSFWKDDVRAERTHAMVPPIVEALKLNDLKLDEFPYDVAEYLNPVFEHAANSAVILFGQPCVWEAVWESDTPGIVVFPEIRFMWHDMLKNLRPARKEFRRV
ncbi:hypothetical protein B0J15DRAFT_551902 [Fusarium solani]|uniref:Uncharacterized protein n=1 Tax=Fusarium solani TaxID=169388 RepID=A0A9P9GY71_FUSSL|nr:uncharacterized protein B0J15DRAFT_551902 [Fusarium solani]KAH7246908.1 hypothetical protein B0J15DRAFT_551902 [Fusarium solani]